MENETQEEEKPKQPEDEHTEQPETNGPHITDGAQGQNEKPGFAASPAYRQMG